MAERILNQDEIAEMEQQTIDRVIAAIEAGDKEGAKKLARRMYNEVMSMHDLYLNWMGATLSFIGERFGNEVLEETLDAGVKTWWTPNLDKMPQGDDNAALRARVKMFAGGLRAHLVPLNIEEDDEKSSSRCCLAAAAVAS